MVISGNTYIEINPRTSIWDRKFSARMTHQWNQNILGSENAVIIPIQRILTLLSSVIYHVINF